MRRWMTFLLLALLTMSQAFAASPSQQRRIDYLIHSIQQLKGASFVRNGKAYGADAAVSHLRLKLRYAGSRVKTAEDFIRLCATGSSMSGSPYLIQFADGHTEPSATFLRERLAHYRSSAAPSTPGPTGVLPAGH